jgi:hypothetical protein
MRRNSIAISSSNKEERESSWKSLERSKNLSGKYQKCTSQPDFGGIHSA